MQIDMELAQESNYGTNHLVDPNPKLELNIRILSKEKLIFFSKINT